MNACEIALRCHPVAGAQMSRLNPFTDGALNPLIGRYAAFAVSILLRHTTLLDVASQLTQSLQPPGGRLHISRGSGNPGRVVLLHRSSSTRSAPSLYIAPAHSAARCYRVQGLQL